MSQRTPHSFGQVVNTELDTDTGKRQRKVLLVRTDNVAPFVAYLREQAVLDIQVLDPAELVAVGHLQLMRRVVSVDSLNMDVYEINAQTPGLLASLGQGAFNACRLPHQQSSRVVLPGEA
jgi:hypothetical protein